MPENTFPMSQEEVVNLMKSSTSETEWSANCDKVKKAGGGQYPSFWYGAIVMSGLASQVMAKFGQTPAIKISSGNLA